MGTGAMMPFSRREFLKRSGQAGLGALAFTLGGATLLRGQPAAQVRDYRLELTEGTWELAPGKVIKNALMFNKQVPGPEIRVKEGEVLRILMRNHLREPTAIHFHGVDEVPTPESSHGIPVEMHAAHHSWVYEFPAIPDGTRWYHPTHHSGAYQIDLGLSGPLIIEAAGPEPFPFDREYTLMFDDWATGTGRPVPGGWEGTAVGGAGRGMGAMMAGMGMDGMMAGMMGAMGMNGAKTWPYDTMTINGKAWPATQPLRVRRGERVRLRFLNPSNYTTHVIRLAGHRLKVTHTDGNALMEPVEVDAVPITVAERYDVLFEANRPGSWFLYCTQPGHAACGEQTLVLYEGQESKPEPPVPGVAGLKVWQYAMGRGREGEIPAPTGRWWNVQVNLMGMVAPDLWMWNGGMDPDDHSKPEVPRTTRYYPNRGDGVRALITNMSMQAHPIHLHGQRFKVLVVDGFRFKNPLIKDVVDVHAHMGTVLIEFTALFPGQWPFHCHKAPHSEGGMFTWVLIPGPGGAAPTMQH